MYNLQLLCIIFIIKSLCIIFNTCMYFTVSVFNFTVSVSSGGVTAQIIRGNITLANGVLHVIDRMLGFVYNTAIEQIGQDAK